MADASQTSQENDLGAKKIVNRFSGIFSKAKKQIENTNLSDVKVSNLIGRAKEDIEALVETFNQKKEPVTAGIRDEATKSENLDSSSGLEVFEQSKVAMEAIKDLFQPKNQSSEADNPSPDENEKGIWSSIGLWLEKVCCPGTDKRDENGVVSFFVRSTDDKSE